MCLEPQVLLFDEPTAALDPENIKIFVNLLKQLQDNGITIIVSTHDLNLLRKVIDRVYLMESGEIVESLDVLKENIETKSKIKKFLS